MVEAVDRKDASDKLYRRGYRYQNAIGHGVIDDFGAIFGVGCVCSTYSAGVSQQAGKWCWNDKIDWEAKVQQQHLQHFSATRQRQENRRRTGADAKCAVHQQCRKFTVDNNQGR